MRGERRRARGRGRSARARRRARAGASSRGRERVGATLGKGPALTLWRDRAFRRYWAGQTISGLGDSFSFVAMPLLVLQATGSVAAMGLLSATSAGVRLLTGLGAGSLLDRFDRRGLMIACDLGRLVVYGALALWWLLRGPYVALLYVATVLGSALGQIYNVGYVTATAGIVDKSRLTEANGYLQSSLALSFVIGPVAAGVVASALGTPVALLVDALTFGASALSIAGLRFGRVGRERGGPLEGLRFVLRQPTLRATAAIALSVSLLASAMGLVDLTIFHVREVLGRGDSSVGAALGASAFGSVLGAVVASRLDRRFGFGPCFLGGTFGQGVALVGASRAGGLPALGVCMALWAFGMTLRVVVVQSMRQRITPDAILGRVTAAFWTIANGMAPLGAALITAGGERWGTRAAFAASGISLLALSTLGAFTAARGRDPEARMPETASRMDSSSNNLLVSRGHDQADRRVLRPPRPIGREVVLVA